MINATTKLKCRSCNEVKEAYITELPIKIDAKKYWICKKCEDEIGEDSDRFDLIVIARRRGTKWIREQLK